jgi:hypothetical protein
MKLLEELLDVQECDATGVEKRRVAGPIIFLKNTI